jgi:RNA polymerase sigma-70 factor (ECF subfamily)
MCKHEGGPRAPLTFDQFIALLQQPPFEPCESELDFLTDAEYEEAFNEVERFYRPKITRYIARITDAAGVAEDLAQEVLNNIYRARVSFERAYIYRSAKNAALKELDRTQRRSILESRWVGVRRYGDKGQQKVRRQAPSAEYLEHTREEAVKRELERLPEKFRVPLRLFAHGKSYEQIVEATLANEGVVRSRICRGKSLLRRRLRAYL